MKQKFVFGLKKVLQNSVWSYDEEQEKRKRDLICPYYASHFNQVSFYVNNANTQATFWCWKKQTSTI